MLTRKAFKFRLKTNSEQSHILSRFAGSIRFVWNKALALEKESLDNKLGCVWYHELATKHLKKWKASEESTWLKESPSQPLQQTLKDLERALKDSFNKKNPKKFPQFKKKGKSDSFRYPQGVKVEGRKVFLPKVGWVSFFKSRNILGTIKNTTVSRKGKHWFVSFQTEMEVEEQQHHLSKTMIGIDLGVKKFATLSDGTIYRPKNSFRKQAAKLKKAQQSLSRKKKFSHNFVKQKRVINNIHTKIANVRLDYAHKVSTAISKNHAMVVLEDLKVVNMSKSAKGDMENPGKNVAAKSGLNKSILDQGWHMFKTLLSYKLEWLKGELILVDPRYTSQKCAKCGHIERANRTSQSKFECVECGHSTNADLNAAQNILAAGHAVLACESNRSDGRKQEPVGMGDLVPSLASA